MVALTGGVALGACGGGGSDDGLHARDHAAGDDAGGADAAAPVVTPSTTMRRLTKAEYENTAADLFPGITFSFDALLDDQRERNQFDNDVSGQGASETLIGAFETAAGQIATKAVASDAALVACGANAVGQDACVKTWLDKMLPRVYRRPPTGDEAARALAFYTQSKMSNDYPTAMTMVVSGLLLTPQFLFRLESVKPGEDVNGNVPLDSWEVASRLSYFLWTSMPDDALFAAAAADQLKTPEQVETQVRRMLGQPRARAAMRHFAMEWLDLDKTATVNKDATLYPQVDATLRASMEEESERFAEWATFDGPGTLDTLLGSSQTFVDAKLAALYGVPAPAQGWSLVTLDPNQRAGILTQASVQAVHAHDEIGSPILRGVFVMERLMCQTLAAPADIPPAPTPSKNGTPPTQTERQQFDAITMPPSCWGCHQQINPLGYGFGHYDAIGKWRNDDHGLPLDVSGTLSDGTTYNGAVEFSKALAKSETVRACVAKQFYRYAMGRQEGANDADALGAVTASFGGSGYKLQELLVAIARSPAFLSRRGDSH